jgi:enterobacteria phage integrase
MPRKLPQHVERIPAKGRSRPYLYFRIKSKGGPYIRLPDDPTSEEFRQAYAAALGSPLPAVPQDGPGTIAALIDSYLRSAAFLALGATSKAGYSSRLATMRRDHGHRHVAQMTRDRIETRILTPLVEKPGAAHDTLKKLRILIRHAMSKGQLDRDPSVGIRRAQVKEIRAWTDEELSAFEQRWPIGTKQRAAFALMLNMGTARADTHRLTWRQVEEASYTRTKTGVPVYGAVTEDMRKALDAIPRQHLTVINTELGQPYSLDGFSRFMRDAITAAGLPRDCQPHGLRKTLGRMLADRGATTHEIMAALGHTTLAEAERYTREADRKRNGRRAIARLNERRENKAS